ncbi:MAG TPA: prolyl oligopeptidase family serine peptidase [Candidatus Dormibacteraeota bacterium]|nr:prolyl oligopeptidase family serine peptidase [Candidatus Dormibacteraeota bacterium]
MRGPGARLRRLGAGAIAALGLALLPSGVSAAPTINCSGTAPMVCAGTTTESSGLVSNYLIEVPSPWNGTLVLYSHGYSFPPPPAPQAAEDVGDDATKAWLLGNGYAIAGSSYATTGWALEQAFQDQIAVLDVFSANVGHPKRTIAWGHSLGGMITAGLVQLFPNRFTAALPMCGVVAGGLGVWNQGLDSEFALLTLQAPGAFKLVNFKSAGDVAANFGAATAALADAQKSPQGRARIALSAALADVPGWFDPASAQPAATDYTAQELNQFNWDNSPDFLFGFFGRAELEARAGGNFSWNTGVDYEAQLAKSTDRAEVKALYKIAGLDLEKDLETLSDAPRIAVTKPSATAYVTKFITYNGDLDMPVLTMHTTGDGLVEVTDEQAYASVVRSAGDSSMLRQVFVHRAGHCTFTPAETISAFKTLVHRIDTGRWSGTSAAALNSQATGLGSALNVAPASFIEFKPGQFLRPFDARNVDEEGDSGDHQD